MLAAVGVMIGFQQIQGGQQMTPDIGYCSSFHSQ
jgi:hypothetical protein